MKSKSNNYLSLEDSSMLYGISILLMVFHHCFCVPSRLNYNYVPVLFGFDTESRIAFLGKLCVAIYAFITGYALSKKKNPYIDTLKHFIYDIKISVNTLIKFYSRFWLVCLIYIPIGILFFNENPSPIVVFKAILIGDGYNMEWWYVFQYIKFLFVFPFLDTFFFIFGQKKYKKHVILWLLAIITLISVIFIYILRCGYQEQFKDWIIRIIHFWNGTYMFIFICAYVIGLYCVYEILDKSINAPWIVNLGVIILLVIIRWIMVSNPDDVRLDIVLTPILIFCIVQLFHKANSENILFRILNCFGRSSTYIWLIHTFWIYYYFQEIIILPKYSVLIYCWTMLICIINAFILDSIYYKFRINMVVEKMYL